MNKLIIALVFLVIIIAGVIAACVYFYVKVNNTIDSIIIPNASNDVPLNNGTSSNVLNSSSTPASSNSPNSYYPAASSSIPDSSTIVSLPTPSAASSSNITPTKDSASVVSNGNEASSTTSLDTTPSIMPVPIKDYVVDNPPLGLPSDTSVPYYDYNCVDGGNGFYYVFTGGPNTEWTQNSGATCLGWESKKPVPWGVEGCVSAGSMDKCKQNLDSFKAGTYKYGDNW